MRVPKICSIRMDLKTVESLRYLESQNLRGNFRGFTARFHFDFPFSASGGGSIDIFSLSLSLSRKTDKEGRKGGSTNHGETWPRIPGKKTAATGTRSRLHSAAAARRGKRRDAKVERKRERKTERNRRRERRRKRRRSVERNRIAALRAEITDLYTLRFPRTTTHTPLLPRCY